MNADQVYSICKYIVSKNIQQGYLSPEDFYVVINQSQNEYLDFILGQYQKYQPGRPIPVVAFAQNERVRTTVAPLIYGTVLAINSTTGISPFPSDFEQVDAMWSLYGLYNIPFIQQDKLTSRYRSTIDPVTTVNPVYLIKHEGFQFYPETLGSARMSYVRTPPSIVWAYVDGYNGLPVYDAANSVAPVWSDTDMMQIIARAMRMVGVSLQSGEVSNYANEIKNFGQ
jgi:hypothetical protein